MQEALWTFTAMETSKFKAVYNAGNREQCTQMARVAWAAHRYEDMLNFMKRVVKIADVEGDDPSVEERGLLWEAYKGVVNARREARKVILAEEELKRGEVLMYAVGAPTVVSNELSPIMTTVDDDDDVDAASMRKLFLDERDPANDEGKVNSIMTTKNDDDVDVDAASMQILFAAKDEDNPASGQGVNLPGLLVLYRERVEDEICRFCGDFVKLLDDQVHAQDEESKAYFLQVKADHLRYICEVQTGDVRRDSAKNVLSIYSAALDIARKVLPARHPTRLGLALNFAVFHIDILGSKKDALTLSREALQDVAEEAETNDSLGMWELLNESKTKLSEELIDTLKGNIELWSTDDDKD